MSTQTPSPNRTTQTKQRDPLRWLIPAALLLLFLTICCIGQVVVVVLSPRDQASDLNLLSKDIADYSPWKLQLILPPIAPEAANAQAAERATEAAQARLSPTPGVVANLPTEEVIVIAAPQNAPTNTPGSALITPQPTVTPRPAIAGPTSTPVISTQEPRATTIVGVVPTAVDTPRPLPTDTPSIDGNPSPRPNTPVPPTATNPPPPNTPTATSTPRPGRTPSPEPPPPPTETPTPEPPPPPVTDTPVPPPPPTETPTPEPPPPPPPTKTNTPVPPPPPTKTNTPTHTPTNTPTHTPTDTPTNTPTDTPTNTPQPTPTPSCAAVAGTLTIAKIANDYTPNVGQQISYTICITNATGAQVLIRDIQDSFPNEWFWGSPSCSFTAAPGRSDLGCSPPGSLNGGSVSWGNPTLGQPVTLNPGDRIDLIVRGSYQGAGVTAGQQWCNRAGSDYNVTMWDNSVRSGNNACVVLE